MWCARNAQPVDVGIRQHRPASLRREIASKRFLLSPAATMGYGTGPIAGIAFVAQIRGLARPLHFPGTVADKQPAGNTERKRISLTLSLGTHHDADSQSTVERSRTASLFRPNSCWS